MLISEHSLLEMYVQHATNLLNIVYGRRKEKSVMRFSTGFSEKFAGGRQT